MEVKIWSRGPKEKGGYAMMPMRKNIPAGRDGWELTHCPACGCECWKTPLLSAVLQQGAAALCSECAIRQYIRQHLAEGGL